MPSHVYKKIEIVGSSPVSIDDAIRNAVSRASDTLDHLRWLEVTDIRAHLEDGEVAHFQVGVKIGFTLNESGSSD